jgi:hypothetical protein
MINRKWRDVPVKKWRLFQRETPYTSPSLLADDYSLQSVCSLLPESEISRGRGSTTWLKGGLDAELEWCLVFPALLSVTTITPATRCILQGSIRERRFECETPDRREMQSERCAQSVLALNVCNQENSAGGIHVSLREIVIDRVYANMCLQYQKENMQEDVKRTVTSSTLARLPLVECVRSLQELIHKSVMVDTSVIRVTAGWNQGSYLQERWMKYTSALTAVRGVHYSDIAKSHIQYRLVTDIVERREYIKRGTEACLSVLSSSGTCVGEARMVVR